MRTSTSRLVDFTADRRSTLLVARRMKNLIESFSVALTFIDEKTLKNSLLIKNFKLKKMQKHTSLAEANQIYCFLLLFNYFLIVAETRTNQ